ncbi:MAG: glycoside hydrolase family 15 protein [Deltaproteobacteria bacterium]|nr:MAG: glycoside hydrolase family 15 protein [Deltaproteobacteria bacterium]
MYPFGLIGNCQISALVEGLQSHASLNWLCLPNPDSEPVFSQILDPDAGSFSIFLGKDAEENCYENFKCHQRYIKNTNVLTTEIFREHDAIRVTDFCPRFEQHSHIFRPAVIIRIVERVAGNPNIHVRCDPIMGWSKQKAPVIRGNSHLDFPIRNQNLRLTTNIPLTYLSENRSFQLQEKAYFYLSWGDILEEDLQEACEAQLQKTIQWWQRWVKHCSITPLFQEEVIRSALALKLHCYEDTGAILAALTTSLPEEIGQVRNWDYRYCWLRDSYFVLSAFYHLGHFEEMEKFLHFLLNIAEQKASQTRLAPVYTLSHELPLPEQLHGHWEGYAGSRPVRSYNQAAEHIQNDVYGEMILTLSPIYLDNRFSNLRTPEHEKLLSHIASLCVSTIGRADAGPWELRNSMHPHTFTQVMSWAGLDRLLYLQKMGFFGSVLKVDLGRECERVLKVISSSVQNGVMRNTTNDLRVDASLSLATILKYPNKEINLATIRHIQKHFPFRGREDFIIDTAWKTTLVFPSLLF